MHNFDEFYDFLKLCQEFGARKNPLYVYDDLHSRYLEPHRGYHTIDHIKSCLGEFRQVTALLRYPNAVEFAIWFHDAVYNTHEHDNEEKSAQLAVNVIKELELPLSLIQVTNLILATKHDTKPTDNDEQLICDIDLSSLGLPSDEYHQNSFKIRQEYSWVPKDQFVLGRSKIIMSFLSQPSIYFTDYFKEKYEKQARINLFVELARLPYTRG